MVTATRRLLLAALALSGCGEFGSLPPCSADGDCRAGDRCVASRCVGASDDATPDSSRSDGAGLPADASPPPADGAPDRGPGADQAVDGSTPDGPLADGRVADAVPDSAAPDPDGPREAVQGPTDASPDAPPDAALDGEPFDAGPRDADPDRPPLDGAPADGPPPDAEPDAIPPDVAQPMPETCNGADDDLDRLVDEGEDGQPLSRPCYDGPQGTDEVGTCQAGTQTCNNGSWSACVGQIVPVAEVCDARDEDCDGVVDNGFDEDEDGVPDCTDVCPEVPDPDQADIDLDGVGDACTVWDEDEDGVEDAFDNCPNTPNEDQADPDGDGVGDACDPAGGAPPRPSGVGAVGLDGAARVTWTPSAALDLVGYEVERSTAGGPPWW